MNQIELARQQLSQSPSRFAGEPDEEVSAWLSALLLQGAPDDCLALAKCGAYDGVADLLASAEAAADNPDAPLCRAAGLVLALGFFFPRPDSWALDLRRARQVLLGEGGFPRLSHKAIAAFYGAPETYLLASELGNGDDEAAQWRCGHIELIAPIMHPLASAFVAAEIGLSVDAMGAVVEGEAYIDEAGVARLFPWYREEDEEVSADAAAQAEKRGVQLPPTFLDEPYEGSWYLARTGLAFLTTLAEESGASVDLTAATIDVVPLLPIAARPTEIMPGGHAMPGALGYAYEVLCSRNNDLQYRVEDDEEVAPWIASMLQEAVALMLFANGVDLGDWSPESPNGMRQKTLTGAPQPRDYHDPPSPSRAMKLIDARIVGPESMLLLFPSALLHVTCDGEVKGLFPHWGDVIHVSPRGLVLIDHGGDNHILDLERQTWCQDTTPDALIAQGRLEDHVFPPYTIGPVARHPLDNSHEWLSGIYTPDHRYYLEVDAEMIGGIYRHGGRRMMAEGHNVMPPFHDEYDDYDDEYDDYDDEYDEYDEEYDDAGLEAAIDELDEEALENLDIEDFERFDDDRREPSGGARAKVTMLLAPEDIPAPTGSTGQRFVIDGVTFALSSGLQPAVDERDQVRFVLHRDRWRFFADATITHHGAPLVRFQTPVFLGAFDEAGDHILVVSRHHAHLIALDEAPRALRHIPLQPAFEAIQAHILGEGGEA